MTAAAAVICAGARPLRRRWLILRRGRPPLELSYRIGRIDASGRVADRCVIAALG
jgi:hypothetical protein